MNNQSIPIGRVFGIPLRIDYSWFLIFALITWTLATGYFPAEFRQPRQCRWEPLPYNPQQSLGLHRHSQPEQIVDASLVGIGQQCIRLCRRAALVEIHGKLQSWFGVPARD